MKDAFTEAALAAALPPDRVLSLAQKALADGDPLDLDLSDMRDKRSRATPMADRRGVAIVAGDVVDTPWGKCTLLAPGRGRDALVVGWTEDGADCMGTAFIEQAVKV